MVSLDKQLQEEKLQAFYGRVPDVEDALPFKDYVLKHEDSRMAWYLLGKQYEAKGQEAKAAYCFSQAGEIYEAFENQAPPMASGELVPNQARRKRGTTVFVAAAIVLAAVLMLQVGTASAPSSAMETQKITMAGSSNGSDIRERASAQPAVKTGTISVYDVVAGAAKPDEAGAAFMAAMAGRDGERIALMIRTPRLDKWTDWLLSGQPVASAKAGSTPGAVMWNWHDAEWCECAAEGGQAARQAAEKWKPVQEMKLALRSAFVQYRSKFGRWPDKLEELAGAYPHNLMAGWSDEMTPWFQELIMELGKRKDGKIPLVPGWPSGPITAPGYGVPAGSLKDLTQMPLEIIVDVSNHRLAVVSGDVLLRNYEVGLGGERTPEGTFYISEKVRNPNGRDDGEFGSRGMTLSNTLYAIHGTNEPDSIGKDESLGCIRMAKEDLEELYDLVPAGTSVTIAKGVLPPDIRVPKERFRLPAVQDETNPHKVYKWLN